MRAAVWRTSGNKDWRIRCAERSQHGGATSASRRACVVLPAAPKKAHGRSSADWPRGGSRDRATAAPTALTRSRPAIRGGPFSLPFDGRGKTQSEEERGEGRKGKRTKKTKENFDKPTKPALSAYEYLYTASVRGGEKNWYQWDRCTQ